MTRGIFITFEGPDGAGKTTQAEMLSAALQHLHPVVVREPGGTEVGERIRELLLSAGGTLGPEAEMYLFMAARAELVAGVIKPALEHDRVVLADRYNDSTLAYQGGGRGLAVSWPPGFPRPDLTFLLAVDPALGLERLERERKPADRLELEELEFHSRVASEYDRLAMQEPARFVKLDGSQPVAEIHQQVLARVRELLAARGAQSEAQISGAVGN